MKILHICLAAFYVDNYSYQENMLPKYHKKLGHDISILASLQTFDKNGNASFLEKESEYINEHGIPVTRIKYKNFINPLVKKIKIYDNVYKNIEKQKPDIIFIHGCQFSNMRDIKKYVKDNINTKVFVDNHCDFSNSATNWLSKNVLHKILWRHSAKLIEPYTTKFYGVLPARVEFIKNMYKISSEKVELLVMGVDDEIIKKAKSREIKDKIRKQYNIEKDDFLIVTGGKIDCFKKQTLLLMEAVKDLNKDNIKLLVFGSVTEELQKEVNELSDGRLVKYIGWVNSKDSYKYFAASDLVIFPGRHSVFWEQVAGLGIPMVCKYWEGTTHIDIGGNCKFLYNDCSYEIKKVIEELFEDKEKYEDMKRVSLEQGIDVFSYSKISERSILMK